MDIFTTQLTRVAPNRIRPNQLKVKSLAKEARSQSIDQEHDHLDEHEANTVTHQHAQKQFSQHNEDETSDQPPTAEQIVNSDDDKDDEGKLKHLDIFV